MDNNLKTSNVRLYTVLSYIGILWLVGLVVKEKDNELVKFHVGQGIILSILNFILGIVSYIFGFILGFSSVMLGINEFFVSLISGLFGGLIGLIVLVYRIIGIVNACNFKKAELPIIGKFAFYK